MPFRTYSPTRRRGLLPGQGFTLIETLVMLTLLSIVLPCAFSVLFYSMRLFTDQMKQYTLEQHGWRAMDRLSTELRSLYPPTLLPLAIDDSDYVSFQEVKGHVAGVVQLGAVTTISLEHRASDLPNGRDDNGDGAIDEGFLVLTRAGAAPVELAANLSALRFNSTPGGLSFSADISLPDRSGDARKGTYTREITFRIPWP